jgi:hypothetical protein
MIEIYTPELRQQYADFLRTHRIVHGIGDKDAACTIAALNVAATGRVTDARPDCMSAVIHAWIIIIQDRMPLALLNSEAWIAAAIDAHGHGDTWRAMCELRTSDSAARAARAAIAARAAGVAGADVWEKLDPCGLLDRLNAVSA